MEDKMSRKEELRDGHPVYLLNIRQDLGEGPIGA